MYPDKFHLTKEQNRRFAKKNLVRLVFTNSRFILKVVNNAF